MGIDVRMAADEDDATWVRCLESSPMATPFHHPEALSVVDAHSDATLHRLLGMNGAEPLGVFPVFEVNRPFVTLVRSPPWILRTMPLGPALANLEGMKPRRAERYRQQFVDDSFDLLEEALEPDGFHVRTDTRFDDTRPFYWRGLDPTPYHTYLVGLRRSTDEILAGFSSDARKNVTDADTDRYDVTRGDIDDTAFIIEQVQTRHDETQGSYRLTVDFVTDLYEALPDDLLRPYVITVDGQRVAGMVTLWFGDRVYRWQGGVRTDVDLPTSDLLDWHIMCEAADEDMDAYDLVGANIRRLSRYKSKFGPELHTYYDLRGQNRRLKLAAQARRIVGKGVSAVRGGLRPKGGK